MRRFVLLLAFLSFTRRGAAQAAGDASRCPSRRRRRRCPASSEPRCASRCRSGDKVEEIREGGRVVMLKVTPTGGKPYYLVDTTGNGNWMRRDSLDDGVRVPMWPIWIFD